jgi:VWFA-related protein
LLALDDYGHYDPTLVANDILVLEDGVPQEVRSVRHIPASVLLMLDTGGGDTAGTGGVSKRTSTTREVAQHIVSHLPEGDAIAVMQVNDKVELVQPWTQNKGEVYKSLARKLFPGKQTRLAEGVVAAANILKERPEGSRHVVLVTDGVATLNPQLAMQSAINELIGARTAVHVISYTELVRQKKPWTKESVLANQRRSAEAIANSGIDPTLPPGTTRGTIGGGSSGGTITFDPAMKRKRKAYEAETKKSQQWLSVLARDTGGQIFLPKSEDDMLSQGDQVARDIGAEYVITYRPKKALAEAAPGEYRRLEIAPRRQGLTLRTMRGYVAKPSS